MSERKLASVRIIDSIAPIVGADKIEKAIIGGWNVVVQKGDYSVGQKVVFFEIDSWIPTKLAPFLSKGKASSEYDGVGGERLRTVKLRGQVSQGLILPVELLVEYFQQEPEVGTDVTEILGIKKWERPIPTSLQGLVKGNFPTFIPQTKQERVQNFVQEVGEHNILGTRFEVTEKLDGTSCTFFLHKGEFGVCSRNLQLKLEGNENNTYIKTAKEIDIESRLREGKGGDGLALQGEIVGEGIQGNPYGLEGVHFFLYNVYDIDVGHYLSPSNAREVANILGVNYVPVLYEDIQLNKSVEEILVEAEGKSLLNPNIEREGLVFKSESGKFSMKVVSNRWLESGGE